VKHIATGEGGAVTTSDQQLSKKLAMLRSHGITKDSSTYVNKARGKDGLNPWYHEMQILGFNYRLCDIQAALGVPQVKRAESNIDRRREIAKVYASELSGIKNLTLPPSDSEVGRHSYHLYPVQIDFPSLGIDRAAFMKQLRELAVGAQVHYIPVHWHPFYETNRNLWLADDTPEAGNFYESELSIPMYHSMSESDQARVISALRKLLS
jgi:dTDP-4-amino-4,6-dideoxygalactose transaminase